MYVIHMKIFKCLEYFGQMFFKVIIYLYIFISEVCWIINDEYLSRGHVTLEENSARVMI